MSMEEEERLNFYSKYNRVKDRQDIDSLYTLIEGADHANTVEIQIVPLSHRREESSRRASASPQPRMAKSGANAKIKEWENDESEETPRKNMIEINEKLEQLRKLERQFHEEMDRREREIQKRKQSKNEKHKNRQKNKQPFISVVDNRESPPSRRPSEIKSKHDKQRENNCMPDNQLFFDDYYRNCVQVPLTQSYAQSLETKKQLREMIEMQRRRQKQVESVEEDIEGKMDSIVIQRLDIAASREVKKEQRVEVKNLCEVELSHSRSENVLDHYREEMTPRDVLVQLRQEVLQTSKQIQVQIHTDEYSPAKNVHFDSNNQDCPSPTLPKTTKIGYWQSNESPVVNQIDSMQIVNDPAEEIHPKCLQIKEVKEMKKSSQMQQEQSQIQASEVEDNVMVAPPTGTEEGSEIKEEIADRVLPIIMKSELPVKHQESAPSSLFLSQTGPKSKLQLSREVKSIATDSLDLHPLQVDISVRGSQIENKKSSFKRLMDENRANLVPRLAFSTILNEHINEALGDFKQQSAQATVSPNLQKSIVQSEVSPQGSPLSSRKKINFKKRIVQQADKSYSRESKPSFERDSVRVQKNRNLLQSFFADN